MTSAADRSRVPAGITTGGQFATQARGEAAVDLTGPAGLPAADQLDAALARLGIDEVPTGVDGVPFTEHWATRFAALGEPEPPRAVDEVARQVSGVVDPERIKGEPNAVLAHPRPPLGGKPRVEWSTLQHFPDPTSLMHGAKVAGYVHLTGRNLPAELVAHPRYLGVDLEADARWSDEPDPTDVTVLIELDLDDDALTDALARRDERRSWEQSRALADDIATGKVAPWSICPVNADTKALIDAEHAASRARVEPMSREHESDLGTRDSRRLNRADLQRVTATLSYLRGESDEEPQTHYNDPIWGIANHVRAGREHREKVAKAAVSQAGLDLAADPSTDPQVLAALEEVGAVRDWNTRVRWAAQSQKRIDTCIAEVSAAADDLSRMVDERDERAAHADRAKDLAWALRWPGPSDECPDAPDGARGGTEPSWG
ncbi:hypothetical protein [Cellulosimicrobium sp. Marseille-Q4280]|uniref:hypothetical protein n=1 Tax=Cellulosimicrobium sp. Marseille-Q4280 TaxID=2937992 RepID=UPI002041322B|nr:hypothetical protein [Cellulosimicrobium sp. Marseille-Q4280]